MKIRFNIIMSSTSGYSNWSLALRLPHQNPVRTSPVPNTCHHAIIKKKTDKYSEYRSDGPEDLDCSVELGIQIYEIARVLCAITYFRSYAMVYLEFGVLTKRKPDQ